MKPIQKILQSRIPSGGPDDKQREKGKAFLWGEVTDEKGNTFSARLETPEAYTLTAMTALTITEKILNGDAASGFQTPAKAFGPGLIVEVCDCGFQHST